MNKSDVPFCGIGINHALEQVNKTTKVLGGIKRITQKPKTLAKFIVVVPELARLSAEAENLVGISNRNKTLHHELSRSVQQRFGQSSEALQNVLQEWILSQ